MNKTVFITGSARRIGRALVLNFAQQGWNVAVNYFSSKDKAENTLFDLQKYGIKAKLFKGDVKDKASIYNAILEAKEYFGTIDVLVNNAGKYPSKSTLVEVNEELWREVFNVNLFGEFFASQAYAKLFTKGRIINFSSLGGIQIWKDRIPYNVSKAAVIQLTKVLARSLAPNFTVNSVAPGAINLEDEPAEGNLIDVKKIPMQRYGSTEDIFSAVYFFATTTTYITGQTLIIDGGLHLSQDTSQDTSQE